MPGVFLWGWDEDAEKWVKVLVDTDGKLRISDADPFEIIQGTPADLKHSPQTYDPTTPAWRPLASDVNGRLLVTWQAPKIIDADGDTKWEVERVADEDKIHGTVRGVEAFLLDRAGILDLAKQSRAMAYLSGAAQVIPTAEYIKVLLDIEAYDEQGEFNNVLSTGTATATTPDKLEDDAATFETDGIIVGAVVWNTTDNTYALVTAIDSETVLSISVDIMANTETYKVANARFTATKAGYYAIVGSAMFQVVVADKQYMVMIYKNGATLCSNRGHSSLVAHLGLQTSIIINLAADDYIELYVYHDAGVNKNIYNAETTTFLLIHKLS